MKIVAIHTYLFELVLVFVFSTGSLFAQCQNFIGLENGSVVDSKAYQSESEITVSDFWFAAGSQTYLGAGEEISLFPGTEIDSDAFLWAYLSWCNSYPDYKRLAMRWAPVVYQDLRHASNNAYPYGIKEDMICKVNFDGDWNVWNNWENTHQYPLKAAAYYSVQETATHYFIAYHFFHPRDAADWDVDKHENDLEGISLCVRKNGTTFGELMALTSIKHNELKKYSQETEYSVFDFPIGVVWEVEKLLVDWEGRPEIFISSNGNVWTDPEDFGAHGHGIEIHDGQADAGDYGIVYHVAENGEMPDTAAILAIEEPWANSCPYELVSINELWYRRWEFSETAPGIFTSFGAFGGDDYVSEAHHANAPWNWNNGGLGGGIGFSDPAHEFDMHFNAAQIGAEVSHQYLYNPYYTHQIDLLKLTMWEEGDGLSNSGAPDMFLELDINGCSYMGERIWKRNNCELGEPYHIYFGKNNTDIDNDAYQEEANRLHISRDVNFPVEIELMDADFLQSAKLGNDLDYKAGDDSYGSISRQLDEGETWGPAWAWSDTHQGQLKYAISTVPTEPIPEAPKFKETNAFNSIDWEWVEGAGRFDEISDYEYSYDGGNSWNNCYAKPQPLPAPVDFSNVLLRTRERSWLCLNGTTEIPIPVGYPLVYQQYVEKIASDGFDRAEQTLSENEFQNSIRLTQVSYGLELSIDFEKWSGGHCIISDANGRVLECRQLDGSRRHRFSSIGWPPGLLIVKIQNEQFSAAFKLLSS